MKRRDGVQSVSPLQPGEPVNQGNRPSPPRRATLEPAILPAAPKPKWGEILPPWAAAETAVGRQSKRWASPNSVSVSNWRRLVTGGAALLVLVGLGLAACAGIGLREPLRVNLVGLESLPGEGMEARFLARIRVQNPNDVSISYNGLSAELDLNGRSFASGVSASTGEIPRFGEAVLELPLTVPATAIVRQVLGLIGGDLGKATYRVHGFLNTGTFGRAAFDSTGEIELPKPSPSSN